MSDIGRNGGGGVLAWCTRVLMDAGAREPLSPGVVSPASASTLGCAMVVSASLTEHTGLCFGIHLGEDLPECGVHLFSHFFSAGPPDYGPTPTQAEPWPG